MSGVVPEAWNPPARDAELQPTPYTGTHLILPLLLAIPFVPARVGPRLAHASIFKALAAHVVCWGVMFYTFATAVFLLEGGPWGHGSWFELTLSEKLRAPVCFLLSVLLQGLGSGPSIWMVLGVIGIIVAVNLGGVIAAAWLLLPFVRSDVWNWRVYVRSVKLVLWSAIVLAMLPALAVTVDMIIQERVDYSVRDWYLFATFLAGCIWWLNVLRGLGLRPPVPDPPTVPPPADPHCAGCGYLLIGQPFDGRCPECGLPVAESLPRARRLPHWARRAPLRHWPRNFFRTARRVVRDRSFFRHLSVTRGQRAALRYSDVVIWAYAIIFGFSLAAFRITADLLRWRHVSLHESAAIGLCGFLGAALGGKLLLVLIAFVAARLGTRNPRRSTLTLCYAYTFLLPTLVLTIVAFVAMVLALGYNAEWFESLPGPEMLYWAWVLGLSWAWPVWALSWGVRRIYGALRDVRFAAC
jgi:hypothetical protein